MPDLADDEETAARGCAFTAGVLVTLFAAALISRIFGHGWSESAFRMTASTMVWPVTWQFYAHPAHQEFSVVYGFDDNSDTFRPLTHPIATAEHRWGLGHSAYAELARLHDTAAAIPPSAWRPCAAPRMAACSDVVAAAPRTTVVSRWASLSGPAVFAVERPVDRRDGSSRRIVRIAVVDLVPAG